MKCPFCDYQDSKVIDSRGTDAGIRRRRQCLHCSERFTTYERVQADGFLVIKKDGRREDYNRDKLISGIRRACAKRPIPNEDVEKTADKIEAEIHRLGKVEVPSSFIGGLVMDELRKLDRIAYIRFASVYRDFADIETLKKEVDALVTEESRPRTDVAQLPLIPGPSAQEFPPKRSKRGRKPALQPVA